MNQSSEPFSKMFFEWTQVYISSKHHHVLHDLKTKNHRFSLKNTLTVPLTPWPSSSWFAPKAHQAPGTAPCNKGKVPPRPGSPRRFWRNLSRNGVVVISKLDQILIEKCCIQLCRFVQIVFFLVSNFVSNWFEYQILLLIVKTLVPAHKTALAKTEYAWIC